MTSPTLPAARKAVELGASVESAIASGHFRYARLQAADRAAHFAEHGPAIAKALVEAVELVRVLEQALNEFACEPVSARKRMTVTESILLSAHYKARAFLSSMTEGEKAGT